MKSSKFWAGVSLAMLLCCASLAFGENTAHSQPLYIGATTNLPASFLTFIFAPGGKFHGAKPANGSGGWGGGGGCGQGGNGGGGWGGGGQGGNGWNNGGGGWGGGGGQGGNGGCGVPEGGNSLEYLALGAMACLGAMVYRTRRQNEVCETK